MSKDITNFDKIVRTGGDSPGDSLQADTGDGNDLRSDTLSLETITAGSGFAAAMQGGAPAPVCKFTSGLLITTQGALVVTLLSGRKITYPSGTFPVNQQIALRVKQIWSTGTTAAGIYIFFET